MISAHPDFVISDFGTAGFPAVYDRTIVYRNWDNNNIIIHNLTTNETTIIYTNTSSGTPDIFGDKVVWKDFRSGPYSPCLLFTYNISTNEETNIKGITNVYDFRISNDRIVWTYSNSNPDVYYHDFSTGKGGFIRKLFGRVDFVKFYGDWITWLGWPTASGEQMDVFIHNFISKEEIQLTNDTDSENHPLIYEDKVLWSKDRWSNKTNYFTDDIYLYNITTKKLRILNTTECSKGGLKIWENKLVWVSYRWYVNTTLISDMILYDLDTEKEIKLVSPEELGVIDFHNHIIVWQGKTVTNREIGSDIHVLDLARDSDIDGEPDYLDPDDDNDGISDNDDAFPNDPAASKDSDGDGYPDEWNPGKSEKDSTTGLKLDDYPNDPNKWKKEERKKEPMPGFEVMSILLMWGVCVVLLRRRKK